MELFVLARAAGDLLAAAVVLVELRRLRLGLPRLALALVAWLVLRGVRALVAPAPRSGWDQGLEAAVDLVTVAVLGYMVVGARRLARRAVASVHGARQRGEEYERARRDYSRLVLHRVFNPLGVIRAAAQTLQARKLDDELRVQLLEAIVSASVEIERLTLEPGRLRVEERGLRPMPAVLASVGADD